MLKNGSDPAEASRWVRSSQCLLAVTVNSRMPLTVTASMRARKFSSSVWMSNGSSSEATVRRHSVRSEIWTEDTAAKGCGLPARGQSFPLWFPIILTSGTAPLPALCLCLRLGGGGCAGLGCTMANDQLTPSRLEALAALPRFSRDPAELELVRTDRSGYLPPTLP